MKTRSVIIFLGVLGALAVLTGPVAAMGLFRPQVKNVDTSKAVAEINADTSVNATKQAMEQPPVAINASGSNNKVDVSVLPNQSRTTTKTGMSAGSSNHQADNSDDSTLFTAGQRLLLLALGLLAMGVVVLLAWGYFKRANPAIAAALSGLASVADTAGAVAINNLRLKLAATTTPEAREAYQHAIAEIEAARGKTAAAAPASGNS